MIKNILLVASFALFLCSGAMAVAYVFDVEPMTAEKHYSMERDIFNRSNENFNDQFPSYADWYAGQERAEAQMYEYLHEIFHQVGVDYAEIWQPFESYVQDTSCGHAGAAPDNWAKGEP